MVRPLLTGLRAAQRSLPRALRTPQTNTPQTMNSAAKTAGRRFASSSTEGAKEKAGAAAGAAQERAKAVASSAQAGAARAFATHQGITAALGSGQAKHQLAAQLMQAEGGNLSRLTADAAHVKEAWQDMVSLGMYDAQLWDTIDLCWEVVLAALNLAATQQ